MHEVAHIQYAIRKPQSEYEHWAREKYKHGTTDAEYAHSSSDPLGHATTEAERAFTEAKQQARQEERNANGEDKRMSQTI